MSNGKQSDWSSLVDSLYHNFILRDLVAKVTPGFVFIATFLLTISAQLEISIGPMDMNLLMWSILTGLAWTIGFGIQFFGNKMGFTKELPSGVSKEELEKAYSIQVRFFDHAKPAELRKGERFGVIKEATGNLLVAIHISGVFLFSREVFLALTNETGLLVYVELRWFVYLISIISWIFLGYALKLSHGEQVIRELKYMEVIVNAREQRNL